jgi:hypothetical protein
MSKALRAHWEASQELLVTFERTQIGLGSMIEKDEMRAV